MKLGLSELNADKSQSTIPLFGIFLPRLTGMVIVPL